MTLRFIVLIALVVAGAQAKSHFVVVGGLGGQPAYEEKFAEQADELTEILIETAGDNGFVKMLVGRESNKEAIESAVEEISENAEEDDVVALFLIGHGTWDGRNYKFNIPGKDITDTELGMLLDGLPSKRQVLVALTSASGELTKSLKKDGRVVITATRSGPERNIVRFPGHYIAALSAPEADTDKSETVSAEEAYFYAKDRVEAFYSDANMMQSEHALLEGDGAGSFVLARSGLAAAAASNPELAPAVSRQEEIERQIEELKGKRTELGDETYFDRLETLLTELANLQTEIEEKASPE